MCDKPGCRGTVCATCRPLVRTTTTVWCPLHRPIATIPRLRWRVDRALLYPGRTDATVDETRSVIDPSTLPDDPFQVAAMAITEDHRWRCHGELRRLIAWVRLTRRRTLLNHSSEPSTVVMYFVHDMVKVLAAHPESHRRVTRPTTPRTWVRRLQAALPVLRAAAGLQRFLRGYQALAPAVATTTHRGQTEQWTQTLDDAADIFRKRPSPMTAALWLAIALGRQGIRPKAALRATRRPSERRLIQTADHAPVWEVRIHIDKDNAVGAVQAHRIRYLPASPFTNRVMQHLPYPSGVAAYRTLFAVRRALLRRHGVTQVMSARRDAAEAAMRLGMDPGTVLNHRPGSRSTPGYTRSLTTPALAVALMQAM